MSRTIVTLPGYHLTEQLHESARTLVYRAQNTKNGQLVVIKLMRHEYPSFSELVQFRNQYAIAKNLEIEGIVKSIALERYENRYALIMEDVGGISLAEYEEKASLSLPQFLEIGIQLCEILHQLHNNSIIHKDIKPANILIHPETKQIKLIDFSISTLLPKETQTIQTPNVLEGTLAYLSPEQTGRMNRGIDYRSDFYSLGVTFYQLLTGRLPFQKEDPLELIHAHIAENPKTIGDICPQPLSDIVLKLMAKNAEDRYQSALGLKYDLEKCLAQYQETGSIEPFVLGERDICDRFLIPEKLYGRENEVQTLLEAFERVAEGNSEMMMVAGFSGIGKTAVVNEVHKPIVKNRGYFIKGKFDQFNRNIPFSAFVQAFRSLMGQILSESDAQLQEWQAKILEAVGNNGQVLIDVIPELERVIGKQPPAPELSGSAAQNRFNLLFEKFIAVFTTQEHPLTMFLDDLQWADSASLNLMKVLMGDSDRGYLLLLGAYRDNEVFPAHPLMLTLAELEKQQAAISTITLASLSVHHINQLIAETFSCTVEQSQPLTELVYQKTQGNPFFTTQFLKGLYEDELIAFNPNLGYWECDLVKVRDAALTDDVVEFMAERLQKLPEATQEVLKLAACIGNQFDLETLAVVCQTPDEEVASELWSALQEGMILPISEAYKFFQGEIDDAEAETVAVNYRFLHDRVQQAAYSLIPDPEKQTTHYRIGQRLLQNTPPEIREERIFELVGQLNHGTSLITDQGERNRLAQFNLIACRKTRTTTAYQAGREYASTGLFLLGEYAWQRQYKMTLEFHELAAELASLCSDFEAMEQFVETVIEQAQSLLEQVNVYCIRILAYVSRNKFAEALKIAQTILQKLGVTFPETLTPKDIQQDIAEINKFIGDRAIETLVYLPTMTNGKQIALVRIATIIMSAAYISGSPLYPILITFSVKLNLQFGNTSTSAFGYLGYGILSCNFLRDVDTGVKFGQLALQLITQLEDKIGKPQIVTGVCLFLMHRKAHMKTTLPLLQKTYTEALEVGNLEQVGHSASFFCIHSFSCGQSLANLEKEARTYYHALVQINQLSTANWCRIYWQLTSNLLGMTKRPTNLSGEAFQEAEFLKLLSFKSITYLDCIQFPFV